MKSREAVTVIALLAAAVAEARQPPAGGLRAAIDRLGNLDYQVRTNAAREIRRAPGAEVVPALMDAAEKHADGYVRFRALVLLTGFDDPRTGSLMAKLVSDPNDRLRQVAYAYFEHHPVSSMLPALLSALGREESEFVRPALVRALAALGGESRVRDTLTAEVDRGVDFFRSAVIEALGDHRAGYAVPALIRVAGLDGPLQDDAVIALGKIGDRRALEVFASLQRTVSRPVQPALAAAICLLGTNCAAQRGFLEETLRFGTRNAGYQELVRAAAAGLAALAGAGDAAALATLLVEGVPAADPGRAAIALSVGAVAVRNTPLVLAALETGQDRDGAILLLRDAFDMLEEDFAEERFFVAVRRAHWTASEGSVTRAVTLALIDKLEF